MRNKSKTFLVSFLLMTILVEPLSLQADLPIAKEFEVNTLRLGVASKPAPFDPFNVTETITGPLMELIFNRLIHFDQNGELTGDLAQRWEISSDGKVYTFYLRKGVLFHDGSPLTSQDLLRTFELYSDPEISSTYHKQFAVVDRWEAPAEDIFRVVLKEPRPNFLLSLWDGFIVPEGKFSNPKQDLPNFIKHPIGSGPFMLSKQHSEIIRLTSNAHYFDDPSRLNAVEVHLYPSKKQVWSAFLRGEIDILFYMNPEDYQEIRQDPQFQIFKSLAPGGSMLIFNFKERFLSDKKIREAVSLAINRQEILKEIAQGEGVLIESPFFFPPDDDLRQIFDPVRAKTLLEEDGFKEENGLFTKDGNFLALDLLVDPKNENLMKIAKLIRQQLQEAGIQVKLHFFKNYQEHQEFLDPKASNFGCFLFFFTTAHRPDVASIYWSSTGRVNYGRYNNPKVDDLFDQASKSNSQENARFFYNEIAKTLNEDHAAVFLYTPYVFHAASRRLSGLEKLSGRLLPFYQIKEVEKNR